MPEKELSFAIKAKLMQLKDDKNAGFQAKLTPGIEREKFLGIKVPELRALEKEFRNTEEAEKFLKEIPHEYYDENLLHSVFISNMKDYEKVLSALEEFLPYVDNWAVCDTMRPSVFAKHKNGLIRQIKKWMQSKQTYTCRFAVDMLMTFFLDKDFKSEYLEFPATIHSDEYYVNMMIAWYYATALAKHWDEAVVYLKQNRLGDFVHNKTIQKACESYRITDGQKEYLRMLKRTKR